MYNRTYPLGKLGSPSRQKILVYALCAPVLKLIYHGTILDCSSPCTKVLHGTHPFFLSRGRVRSPKINSSVTRFANFWKFWATNLLTRVAQIFGDFWAFKKQKYLSKKCSEYAFGQLSEIFGDLWAFKKQKYLSKKCSESAFGPLSETLGRSFSFQYLVALK